jgi:hypothetical protein
LPFRALASEQSLISPRSGRPTLYRAFSFDAG